MAADVIQMPGTAPIEPDLTQPFLAADERRRYCHVNGGWGIGIALGLRHKPVWPGTHDEAACAKRRAKNRVARRSRAINRSRR